MTIFCKKYQKNKVLFTCIPEVYDEPFKQFLGFFEKYAVDEINGFYIYTKEHILHVLSPQDGTVVPIFKVALPTDPQAENDYLTLFRLASHFKEKHKIDELMYEICLDLQSFHIDDFSKMFNIDMLDIQD